MATTSLFVPLLLLVACFSDVFHHAAFAVDTVRCNQTYPLTEDSTLDLSIDLALSHSGPSDCWLLLEAPANHLVSVQGMNSGQETEDTTCSSWASFLDGGDGTPITDKICHFNDVYKETTGSNMLIWYHVEAPARAQRLHVRVQALRCPTICEDRISLDKNGVEVEPFRRTGDNCSRDSCFWSLCAPVEHAKVELHAKAYRQGDFSKCDYSNVVLYDGQGSEGQAGPSCETSTTSAAQCMLLQYKLGGSSSRFLAYVTTAPYGDDAANTWVMGTVIPIVAILSLLFLVAFGWVIRLREVRNISTQTSRRAAQQRLAQGESSTDPIPSVSQGVADLPPSYSSVCMDSEERPPAYPAEQYELHESFPSPPASPLTVVRGSSSSLRPPSPEVFVPLNPSPISSPPCPSPPAEAFVTLYIPPTSRPPRPSRSQDMRTGESVDTDRS